MGSLEQVWTDLPEEEDEAGLKLLFARIFAADWDQVLVGVDKPFSLRRYWNGYFSVTGLTARDGLTLADLAGSGCLQRFNLLVG